MKNKLSISVDQGTNEAMEDKLKEGLFRNKSHLVEFAVKTFLERGPEK